MPLPAQLTTFGDDEKAVLGEDEDDGFLLDALDDDAGERRSRILADNLFIFICLARYEHRFWVSGD